MDNRLPRGRQTVACRMGRIPVRQETRGRKDRGGPDDWKNGAALQPAAEVTDCTGIPVRTHQLCPHNFAFTVPAPLHRLLASGPQHLYIFPTTKDSSDLGTNLFRNTSSL